MDVCGLPPPVRQETLHLKPSCGHLGAMLGQGLHCYGCCEEWALTPLTATCVEIGAAKIGQHFPLFGTIMKGGVIL